jgi:hypothetical protein
LRSRFARRSSDGPSPISGTPVQAMGVRWRRADPWTPQLFVGSAPGGQAGPVSRHSIGVSLPPRGAVEVGCCAKTGRHRLRLFPSDFDPTSTAPGDCAPLERALSTHDQTEYTGSARSLALVWRRCGTKQGCSALRAGGARTTRRLSGTRRWRNVSQHCVRRGR